MSVKVLYDALGSTGLDVRARRSLACIGEMITKGNPAYNKSAGGKGAWGVDRNLWGTIPADLAGQATIAARIYNSQIATLPPCEGGTEASRVVVEYLAWWNPTSVKDHFFPCRPSQVDQSLQADIQVMLNQIGSGFPWKWIGIVAGVLALGGLIAWLALRKK